MGKYNAIDFTKCDATREQKQRALKLLRAAEAVGVIECNLKMLKMEKIHFDPFTIVLVDEDGITHRLSERTGLV